MSWIVDSSIAMAWCFDAEATERTDGFLYRLESEPGMVPLHWSLEVTNALRNAIRRKRLTEEEAASRVAMLMSLPIQIDPLTTQFAFTEIYRIARAHTLTTYDAAYLELAIRINAELATNDEELIAAAKANGVKVL